MAIETTIRRMRSYSRQLDRVCFTVGKISKTGEVTVRLGKKIIVATAPTQEAAMVLQAELQAVVGRQRDKLAEAMRLLEAKVEQLSFLQDLTQEQQAEEVTVGDAEINS